jgi:hypothetical protein
MSNRSHNIAFERIKKGAPLNFTLAFSIACSHKHFTRVVPITPACPASLVVDFHTALSKEYKATPILEAEG